MSTIALHSCFLPQDDDDGWTPLHHAVQATVYWEHASKVVQGLVLKMSVEYICRRTRASRPSGWPALNMCANGSDVLFQRAKLCQFLIEAEAEASVVLYCCLRVFCCIVLSCAESCLAWLRVGGCGTRPLNSQLYAYCIPTRR